MGGFSIGKLSLLLGMCQMAFLMVYVCWIKQQVYLSAEGNTFIKIKLCENRGGGTWVLTCNISF